MSWISVKEKLPNLFEIVWIYWRDREVLLGCRTDDDCEPHENWYSLDDEKCKWTNCWQYYRIHKPSVPNEQLIASDKAIMFRRAKVLADPILEYGKHMLIKDEKRNE